MSRMRQVRGAEMADDRQISVLDKFMSDWRGLLTNTSETLSADAAKRSQDALEVMRGIEEAGRNAYVQTMAGIERADEQKAEAEKAAEKALVDCVHLLSTGCELQERIGLLDAELDAERMKLKDYQDWTGIKFDVGRSGSLVAGITSLTNGHATHECDLRTSSKLAVARKTWAWLEEQHYPPPSESPPALGLRV